MTGFKDTSGLMAMEFNVVVKPKALDKKTAGGLIIPDEAHERDEYAQERGQLVSVSPVAFSYEEWPAGARKPQPGDHVVYRRYAGMEAKGGDGEKYRIIKDSDIVALVREAV